MAKRRHLDTDSEDRWGDDGYGPSESDSGATDASFIEELVPKAKHIKKRRVSDGSSIVHESYMETTSVLHPKSRHVIKSPMTIRTALLQWYATVHDSRGMPWRKPYNSSQGAEERAQRAYEVWVSEVMLQQTQVATVIPYYNRWMKKFPTICDLAAATIDQVNAEWKGLGYYSRASRLLAGAQKVVRLYDGKLPDNASNMEANIPGIGRYSAGAICSIAYGERVPVLDGNVHRLLSRFLALHAPPKAKATLDLLWAAASAMVEQDGDYSPSIDGSNKLGSSSNNGETNQHPGDINQALIELGSTVCKVREPSCESCPLRNWCAAYQEKTNPQPEKHETLGDIEDACQLCEPISGPKFVTAYPMKAERKKPREEIDIVNVIEWRSGCKASDRYFLLLRRPEGGLLAGLYEFPSKAYVPNKKSFPVLDKEAYDILLQLIRDPVLPLRPGKKTNRNTIQHDSLSEDGKLQVTSITPVGDILHVFSHIKKTYRTQWIVVEGGTSPPSLNVKDSTQKSSQIFKKGKRKRSDNDPVENPNIDAIWTVMSEVTDANMGTGVVKVWNLTKRLWEGF